MKYTRLRKTEKIYGKHTNNLESKNTQNKLKILYANCQSVRNKREELFSTIIEENIDIVSLVETWVSEKMNGDILSEYELDGFNTYFYQRDERRGGGVILIVKEGLEIQNNESMKNNQNVESIWLDIKCKNKTIKLGTFYRPPNTDRECDQMIFSEIKKAIGDRSKSDPVVVMGDFNYGDIDWELFSADRENSKEFLEIVSDCFLNQLILSPTRGPNII